MQTKPRLMNRFYTLLFAAAFSSTISNAQISTPQAASPAAVVIQTIGISTVEINYSRPAVRDREIWGALVPYGYNKQNFGAGNEAPWRAGANENTTITLSHDAMIEGQEVTAGTYGLFFVIFEDNSGEVILSSDHQSWGSYWYDPANDVMKAKIKLDDIPHTERLTYDFVDIDRTSATLVLDWEEKRFPFKINFDVDAIVMANATEELKGTTGFSWQGYHSAAQYAIANETNLEQALAWATIASTQNPAFNTLNVKAQALEKLGKAEEAKETKAKAIEMANEAQLNFYGYQLLNAEKYDEAIEMFTLNTKRNPKSANAWDSLGEACFKAGKKQEAKKYFQKVLKMDPPANVKANSEKYLEQI